MVLPEGTHSEEERPRRSRTILFALAFVAVTAAVLTLGALTSPDPEALPSPSTSEAALAPSTTTTSTPRPQSVDVQTFGVEEIETGHQFDWELAAEFGDAYPHTMVSHEGWLYLFGSATPIWAPEPGGLTAWRSRNGTDWESLGNVLGYEVEITHVEATAQGLVALERSQDSAGFNIWLSDDGIDWTPRWVPTDGGARHVVAFPQGLYGDEERLVVGATFEFDGEALLEEHLRAVGQEIDLTLSRGWGTDYTEDGVQLVVYGPLGIPVIATSAEELGLTGEEIRRLENGLDTRTDAVSVWVSEEGAPWVRGQIEGAQWIESIVGASNRELFAFGFGVTGEQAWRSVDGLTWEESSAGPGPLRATTWRESLLAAGGSAEILVSKDAENWEETGLRLLFPAPIDWQVSELTASPAGIAAAILGWEQTTRVDPQRPATPTLRDGTATLSLDFDSGHFEMEVGDDVLSWRMYGEIDNGIETDLSEQVVIFLHPDSGDELGRFGFDDLEAAEQEYWVGAFSSQEFHAMVFSEDARSWSIQDVDDEFGDDSRVAQLEMVDGRLVAAVVNTASMWSSQPNPGFEVWTAPLP